jgi:quercetin dioxygenase-like cupin family protein
MTVLLDAVATGGALTVVSTVGRSGDGAPVHLHSREDEAVLLLSGAATVWSGDERYEVASGGVAFLPRGVPHSIG